MRTELRQASGGAVAAVAWVPRGRVELREWLEQGRRFGAVGRGIAWWIGDWLRYGNAEFGERYPRAERITGYDRQSLMNMVYVSSRFEPDRRRQQLSWSHHSEVASLPHDQQDHWLDFALAERLSVHALRGELRAARRAPMRLAAPPAERQSREPEGEKSQLVCPKCNEIIVLSDQAGVETDTEPENSSATASASLE